MDIPSIINHNYYVLKDSKANRTWICEAERFDDKDRRLYYYYGTYELGSDEHKNNCYLSDSYYDILATENDEVRLATMEEIDILIDILEKNGIGITLQEAKDKAKAPDLKGEDYSGKRFGYKIPDGYEFDTVDNGEIILKPIKPKYPKTYKECCDVLLIPPYYNLRYRTYEYGHYNEFATSNNLLSLQDKLNTLGKVIICRDAYWKIYGEYIGLGKPWEPDWMDETTKYGIRTYQNIVIKDNVIRTNCAFVFPTPEIQDAFYENFKDLIEKCKELL